MTFRSVGVAAVVLSAVVAALAFTIVSPEVGLAFALLALVGPSFRAVRLDRELRIEKQQTAKAGFLAQLSRDLLAARDVDDVWQRAVSGLGAFLGATRVALYRPDGYDNYRLWAQFAAEDVRPLDPVASLPSPFVEPGAGSSSDKKVVVIRAPDEGETIAIVVYRAAVEDKFLDRFHDAVRRVADFVARRASQARLAELRGSLLHLAHALASTSECEATLDLAVTASAPLARCQGGAVFLDNGASGWRTAAEYGLASHLTPAVLSRLLPKLDTAAAERVPVEFQDGGVGFLIVPMFHGRELLGVLLLGRDCSEGAVEWDEADLEVARLTSQLAATGLKNALRTEELIGAASQADGLTEMAFDLHIAIDEQGIVRNGNPVVLDALRTTRAEIEGRRFEDLLDRRSARAWARRSRELFRHGSLTGEAMSLIDNDGGELDVILNAYAFSSTEAHLVMKDVTESKSLRLQLQQSQKQEVLGLLASGIAHDLNNVLGGVLGYASLARRRSADPLVAKYVGTIERSAMRGAALTGRLLSASRKGGTRYEPVSLNQLVQDTLEIVSHSIPKTIAIETHLDPSLRVMMADPGQLQQVLLNLCVNARDAMKDGGCLRLSTRLCTAEGRVQLTIEDSGVGMDTKTLERLFEPFFSTKGASGTGLGLSVVHNIVKSLSGEIRVQSSPGKGSRFDVFLPCLWADEDVAADETEEPLGEGELVLLVDDEQVMRELGKDILESQGYRVEAVASGEEAIEFLCRRDELVALVVLDLVMPGLDGTETYHRLRSLDRALPVLLSSGLSAEGAVKELLHDRATDFLGKPYGTAELARAVKNAIAGAKGSNALVH